MKSISKAQEALESHLTEGLREISLYCVKRCDQDLTNGFGFVIFDSQLDGSSLLRLPSVTALLHAPTVFDVEYDSCASGHQKRRRGSSEYYISSRSKSRTNVLSLATRGRTCPGLSPSHQHELASDLSDEETTPEGCVTFVQRFAGAVEESGLLLGTERVKEVHLVETAIHGRKVTFVGPAHLLAEGDTAIPERSALGHWTSLMTMTK